MSRVAKNDSITFKITVGGPGAETKIIRFMENIVAFAESYEPHAYLTAHIDPHTRTPTFYEYHGVLQNPSLWTKQECAEMGRRLGASCKTLGEELGLGITYSFDVSPGSFVFVEPDGKTEARVIGYAFYLIEDEEVGNYQTEVARTRDLSRQDPEAEVLLIDVYSDGSVGVEVANVGYVVWDFLRKLEPPEEEVS